MEKNTIRIHVPISISYTALEEVIRKKMVGELINKPGDSDEEAAYARILDVRIAGSSAGAYDLLLEVKVSILRTLLKRDNVNLHVPVSLGYDNERQLLYLRKYKVDVRTQSRFYNASLEVLANNVVYERVMKKARFNLRERIGQEIIKVNGQLEKGLEIKGARLTGAIEEISVLDIATEPEGVSLALQLGGHVQAEVFDLTSLLPANL